MNGVEKKSGGLSKGLTPIFRDPDKNTCTNSRPLNSFNNPPIYDNPSNPPWAPPNDDTHLSKPPIFNFGGAKKFSPAASSPGLVAHQRSSTLPLSNGTAGVAVVSPSAAPPPAAPRYVQSPSDPLHFDVGPPHTNLHGELSAKFSGDA